MTAKDLKNALLQEAVQGKLVPQIASEGNARDLLEEIRNEKLSHGLDFANAKSGKRKSKKETALAGSNPCDITEEEIPFEIPENWCWCRLSDIGEINRGRSQHRPRNDISLYENGTIPFIQTGDVAKASGIILEPKTFYNEKGLSQSKLWKKGTICLTIAANIGDVAVLNFDACFPDSVVGFNGYEKVSDNKYVMYTLMWYKDLLDKLSHSTAQKNINLEILSKIVFPLPPLSEQKRIVAAIEKFMPLIEEYGKKETQLKAINEKIGTLTKKAILQEAVQGKLVPQIVAEGNAKDLLEEIKKEKTKLIKEGKIKKEKTLPEITEDEIPFDIPENWCWCRLGEIVNYKMGKTPPRAESEWWGDKNDIPWISIADMVADGHINKTKEFMSWKAIKEVFNNTVSKAGTLIMSFKLTVGRVSILDIDATHNEAIISIYPYIDSDYCTRNYLFKVLPLLSQNGETKDAIKGRTLNSTSLSNMLIPLPPLAEQKRIVAAIEKILPLCENLGK